MKIVGKCGKKQNSRKNVERCGHDVEWQKIANALIISSVDNVEDVERHFSVYGKEFFE